jgi:GNAT superfamily N-acetyltransferase
VKLVRYADRPDLLTRRYEALSRRTFPEYMQHNEPGGLYWRRLYEDFPDFQVALLDGEELVAEAHALPVAWDGTLEDLPTGWDEGFVRGMTSDREPTCLQALAISVLPSRQGERLSSRMIDAFRDTARAAALGSVLAPVRPTLKERYPLIPIEEYIAWRRDDGSHFDPWIRLHERVGGEIIAAAPESMIMRAPVADWEEWTGMRFPADGEYVFPGALATLVIEDGVGTHVEPNVWLRHAV